MELQLILSMRFGLNAPTFRKPALKSRFFPFLNHVYINVYIYLCQLYMCVCLLMCFYC